MATTTLEPERLFEPDKQQFPAGRLSRVLLKLSGEAFAGEQSELAQELLDIFIKRMPSLSEPEAAELLQELMICLQKNNSGFDPATVARMAQEIFEARRDHHTEFGVVVGGGNIWRGSQHPEMDRTQADKAGMVATIINALALQDHLEKLGVDSRVMSAIEVNKVAEPYISRRAIRHIKKGRVVLLAGGTGNPLVTTDAAAVLRAAEIDAQAVLMAKHGVDGIYDVDPKTHSDAVRYESINYLDVIQQRLKVMDLTAVTMAMENGVPIVTYNGLTPGALDKILRDPTSGTIISN